MVWPFSSSAKSSTSTERDSEPSSAPSLQVPGPSTRRSFSTLRRSSADDRPLEFELQDSSRSTLSSRPALPGPLWSDRSFDPPSLTRSAGSTASESTGGLPSPVKNGVVEELAIVRGEEEVGKNVGEERKAKGWFAVLSSAKEGTVGGDAMTKRAVKSIPATNAQAGPPMQAKKLWGRKRGDSNVSLQAM